MNELTQEYVRSLFDYRDGELYWKESKGQRGKIGNISGSISNNNGYRVRTTKINGKNYKNHQLIFLFHRNYIPEELDHIDGNSLNNSIDNLREATHQENGMNRKKGKFMNSKPTSSRFKGVYWDKRSRKWISRIRIKGKSKYLGSFTSEIDAALAYDVAAIKYFGKYALTNAMMFPEIFKNLKVLQPKGL